MRTVWSTQGILGQVAIEDIEFDPRSRDDIPAVLKGIQFIHSSDELRAKVFDLLQSHLLAGSDSGEGPDDAEDDTPDGRIDAGVGRPGMQLWNILVLGLLKQGLNCDYDRLHELACKHADVRRMLGCSDICGEPGFSHRTLVRNVALLTPELLGEVNRLVVEAGHELAGHDGAGQLQARCDSVVVETDVHYPTDVSLLWDALRCLIRVVAAVCQRSNVGGWRQARHLSLRARGLFNRVRSSRQRSRKGTGAQRVRRHLQFAGEIAGRAEGTLEELGGKGATEAEIQEIQWFLDLVNRLADQVKRRVLEGERIAQEEKIYSIYEPHTRWCSKGKAGKAVELGVPVSVVESEHQFVMHYKVMWSEQDVDVAPSMIEETQELHPGLTGCSFDKGYSSPGNRTRLDGMLDLNAMPKKGKLAKADKERETAPEFVEARRAHAAVESAINNLEQRGFDRILAHGADGFERMVGLSVLAANIHRIGTILQRREREKLKGLRLPLAA